MEHMLNRHQLHLFLWVSKQWGFTVFDPVDYKNVNFTLPLSVNGTFCAFSTGYDPKGSTFLWHSMSHFNNVNVGVTGFVFDSRYTFTGLGYLAVCWQKQWGTNTIGSRTTRTEAYPLPYSEFCLPIVSGKGYVGGLNYGFGVGVTNFGLTSVTIANNSEDSSYRWTGYTYIVVGAQPQWGTSVSPIIFSISFSNTMYTILQMPQSASTSAFRAEVWALERKDQDSCAFFTGSGNYSRHWIAVGF